MKLRLFALRDKRSRQCIPGLFFNTKPDARAVRDEYNKGGSPTKPVFVVSYGPDHHRYNHK